MTKKTIKTRGGYTLKGSETQYSIFVWKNNKCLGCFLPIELFHKKILTKKESDKK